MAIKHNSITGFSMIRLPDPHHWDKIHSTHLINAILFCVFYFNEVKIFKTPWGTKSRYYLLIASPKIFFNNINYGVLLNHINNINKYPNISLFNEIDIKNTNNLLLYISTLNKLQYQLSLDINRNMNEEDFIKLWFMNMGYGEDIDQKNN